MKESDQTTDDVPRDEQGKIIKVCVFLPIFGASFKRLNTLEPSHHDLMFILSAAAHFSVLI